MSNKQSSIELFIDQLEEKGKAYEETVGVRTVNICIDVSDYMELKQQAKAMHKEEIRKTINDTQESFWGVNYQSFDDYYNETFGE